VLNYLRGPLAQSDAAVSAWYRHWVASGLQALETQAARTQNDARHLVGSQVTLADICLVPQMYNARRFECDLAPYPTLRKISAYLEELPAFAGAAPAAQPDAVF
jgi:maleylpyruvate isomerase